MKLERPNFFTDTDYRDELIYGIEGRYRSLSVDFWKEVYPNILKAYFDINEPDKKYEDVFTNPYCYPLNLESILRLCILPFIGYFRACFEPEIPQSGALELSEPFKKYKDKNGILGVLGRIDTGKRGQDVLEALICVFELFNGNRVQLSKNLPLPLYDSFVKEIKTPFYMLADFLKKQDIRKEIDKFVFIKNPKALKKIPKPKQFELLKIEHCRTAIVFKNIEFGKKEQELFWNLVCFPGAFYTLEGICLKDCYFSSDYICPFKSIQGRAIFNNCRFAKTFAPAGYFRYGWTFEHCIIKDTFDFRQTHFERGLHFYNCTFQKGSWLRLDGSQFRQEAKEKKTSSDFSIFHTLFSGPVSFREIKAGITPIRMENVSFGDVFYFDEADIGKVASFKSISFLQTKSPKVAVCKKVLADILNQHGYKSDAEALGLISTLEDENNPFNVNDWQFTKSCQIGWLNPTQAALFISKSKSWLAKQRIADRKKKSKYSIPFVGEKKSILYPKKALEAYRVQDWNLLNTLCEEYGFGKLENPVEENEKISEHFTKFAKSRTK